jgi:hypothetical protein
MKEIERILADGDLWLLFHEYVSSSIALHDLPEKTTKADLINGLAVTSRFDKALMALQAPLTETHGSQALNLIAEGAAILIDKHGEDYFRRPL